MRMAMGRWRGMRAQSTMRPRLVTRPRDGSFRYMCLACAELFPSSGLGDEPAKPASVVLDDLLAAVGELFLHLVGEEEAHVQVHDGAEPYELVRPHLALPVEDVPRPLAVDGCASRELGYADSACVPRFLHPYCDQLRVIHPLNCLPSDYPFA